MEKIEKACQNIDEEAFLLLLAHTGLRAAEFCALKLSDIDLSSRILTVQCGKGGKSRRVGLNNTAFEVLGRFLKAKGRTSEAFLFQDANGNPLDRTGLYHRLQRLSKRAGVPVSPHALRRAFVTINANKGRPLQMLQIACGHSDIKTTMSYCRTTETEVIDAMKDW